MSCLQSQKVTCTLQQPGFIYSYRHAESGYRLMFLIAMLCSSLIFMSISLLRVPFLSAASRNLELTKYYPRAFVFKSWRRLTFGPEGNQYGEEGLQTMSYGVWGSEKLKRGKKEDLNLITDLKRMPCGKQIRFILQNSEWLKEKLLWFSTRKTILIIPIA